jgi:5-methylcytosine-specific restriction endonuclease McrA
MKKKTINYVANAIEEAAISFLAEKSFANEEDYHLVYEDSDLFLNKLKDLSYAKRRGWQEREEAFIAISKRITNNQLPQNVYYSKYYFSIARSRFVSIAERSFERIIDEQFHTKVFFKFISNWNQGILKKDFKDNEVLIEQLLSSPGYEPDETWTEYRCEIQAQAEIKLLYKDMTKVRFRNLLQKAWEKIYSEKIKAIKNYYPSKFEERVNLHNFLNYYGPDDKLNRCCGYCGISEGQVDALDKSEQILTKRIYHRGRTMEVDKKDPMKDYSDPDNLILSCYWCNNAKTDEFSIEEFMDIARAISQVWQQRIKEIIKKAS